MLDAANRAEPLFAHGIQAPVSSGLVAGDFDGDVELLYGGSAQVIHSELPEAKPDQRIRTGSGKAQGP